MSASPPAAKKSKMDERIRITGIDGRVESVTVRSNGTVSKITLHDAFLLRKETPISLLSDGAVLDGDMDVFALPLGYEKMEFHLKWDHHQSVNFDGAEYVPIEMGEQLQQLERNILFYEKSHDEFKRCFTILSVHHAVSYNHSCHKDYKENETIVTICNQDGKEFETIVVECDEEMDFIVVRSNNPLVLESPRIGVACKMERYILLGYPSGTQYPQALEGVFSSIERDQCGRMRGSSGSSPGFSGGPIINYRGELLGINVANESPAKFVNITLGCTIKETLNELAVSFPPLSVIVPSIYIAMQKAFRSECHFKEKTFEKILQSRAVRS